MPFVVQKSKILKETLSPSRDVISTTPSLGKRKPLPVVFTSSGSNCSEQLVGDELGDSLGETLGALLGLELGDELGLLLGDALGEELGEELGMELGEALGDALEDELDRSIFALGEALGDVLRLSVGELLCLVLGAELGLSLGESPRGWLGPALSEEVGDTLGDVLGPSLVEFLTDIVELLLTSVSVSVSFLSLESRTPTGMCGTFAFGLVSGSMSSKIRSFLYFNLRAR